MPLYENVFLVRPDVSASQVETLAKEFSTIIEENGGAVPKVEHWGLRTLAFRMKKNRKAHYVLLNIDAGTDTVREMERNMRIHEDVLRHLTIRVEELEEQPSVIMQSKGSRDERRRDDRGGRGSSRRSEEDDKESKETKDTKEAKAQDEPPGEKDKKDSETGDGE